MNPTGLFRRSRATDEEDQRWWDPAGLDCHPLIVAYRPVLDHETVADPLEVRLLHAEGLARRCEHPFYLRVLGPGDEVAGVPTGHRAERDDEVVLSDASFGRPAEVGEGRTQPLSGGVKRPGAASACGGRFSGGLAVGRLGVDHGDEFVEGAAEDGVDRGLCHRHALVTAHGAGHGAPFDAVAGTGGRPRHGVTRPPATRTRTRGPVATSSPRGRGARGSSSTGRRGPRRGLTGSVGWLRSRARSSMPSTTIRGTRAVGPALWTAEGWAEEDIDHILGVLEHCAAYPAGAPHALTRLLGRPPRAFGD